MSMEQVWLQRPQKAQLPNPSLYFETPLKKGRFLPPRHEDTKIYKILLKFFEALILILSRILLTLIFSS